MTTEMESEVKRTAAGPLLCFIIMMSAGVAIFVMPASFLIAVPALVLFSMGYFIYYLIHTGQHKKILSGIIISLVITILVMMIPVFGWIALSLWIFYNILRSLKTIKNLLPGALFSAILFALLVTPGIHNFSAYSPSAQLSLICFIAYTSLTVIYCLRLNRLRLDTQTTLFKCSMMWLSAPMIFLLVVSIVASVRTAFRAQTSIIQSKIKVPQQVSGYMRGNTAVQGYTRNITQTITTTSTTLLPGSGAVAASAARSLGDTTSTEGLSRDPWHMNDVTSTDKALHFYRDDEMDTLKLGKFITSLNASIKMPLLRAEDVLFYFDDTVFGSGDRGVVITRSEMICDLGKAYKCFRLKLSDIKALSISGSLNKTIKILTHHSAQHKFTLTQSNKGAEKLFYVLNTLIP